MRTLPLFLAAAALAVVPVTPAGAVDVGLFEWAVNIDGAVADPTLGDPIPGAVNVAAFDDVTGLGTISVSLNSAGSHFVGLFVDHEILEPSNTFFNETGAATGAAAAGQTWEIDEPGYVNGDIFENLENSSLDNGIGTSIYGDTTFPDDVSMALGWDYSLAAGQTSALTFRISDSIPMAAFYLTQTDAETGESIYFSSALDIRTPGAGVIPEPTTWALYGMGLGLAAVAGLRRRQRMEV